MAGDLSYAHEKFASGVRILATHPGAIRERLAEAYQHQVLAGTSLMDGTGLPFPDDLAERVRDLAERMAGDGGPIGTTLDAMPDREVVELAGEVCDLNDLIGRTLQQGG